MAKKKISLTKLANVICERMSWERLSFFGGYPDAWRVTNRTVIVATVQDNYEPTLIYEPIKKFIQEFGECYLDSDPGPEGTELSEEEMDEAWRIVLEDCE